MGGFVILTTPCLRGDRLREEGFRPLKQPATKEIYWRQGLRPALSSWRTSRAIKERCLGMTAF